MINKYDKIIVFLYYNVYDMYYVLNLGKYETCLLQAYTTTCLHGASLLHSLLYSLSAFLQAIFIFHDPGKVSSLFPAKPTFV